MGAIDDKQLRTITHELDELPLPYLFDVIHYDKITHDDLRTHIDRYGKSVFCLNQDIQD
jgi:hypothetical protein